MRILVLDCKEYAIRFSLADMETKTFPVCGKVESIGMAGATIHVRTQGKSERQEQASLLTHKAAIEKVIDVLIQERAISSKADLDAVAHRVVHGGESFQTSTRINEKVIEQIRRLRPLAPLHNPAELEGILATRQILPDTPQVANFDTAFYATMPDHAFIYGLPFELYKRLGVRRYGFHGLSHRYLMHRTAKLLEKNITEIKIVSCHLGSGCSITAIDRGTVKDTSMGFTPTEGLAMDSRCGDIDPGLIPFLKAKERLTTAELLNLFNKFSGLRGLSGTSGEMAVILDKAEKGDERCQIALGVFSYRVKKYIAAYMGVLGGADALVFSAGIGVNAPIVRQRCVAGLEFLGVQLDPEKNQAAIGKEALISSDDSPVKVFAMPDNEELTMAFRTRDVIQKREEGIEEDEF